ncbi:hypothetical protein AGDE_02185 [Angomonas deanei]|nr:hypothetical protein AGDE_02185 [Angomonas deanei]|eukprot:EPY41739.1 hypothetical protein AGDE_02185 [Angomonas deanei]
MSSNLVALQKELQQLETRAKNLRSEVDYLESTHRNIEVSQATTARASEMRMSQENSIVPAKRKTRASKQPEPLGLPQDFVDQLVHKSGDVENLIKEHKQLNTEKAALQAALEEATRKAQEEEQQMVSLSELAGADSDGKSALTIGIKKKNEYQAALKGLVEDYNTRDTVKDQLLKMQAELERLAGLVEETISAEEQLEEGRAILTEKKKHLIELKEEHRKLDRNVRTKDKVLEKKPTGATEEEIVRSANYDRQVALYEKSKEEDQIKLNELAVRHRAMEISKAEKRLEMIGDAVTGDGLDEEERVDVELVDELIEEIKGLYNLEIEARAKIDQVDAEVERIEYRVSALELTTDSTRKEMGQD